MLSCDFQSGIFCLLFFSADDRLQENRRANAVIESSGRVFWMPQAVFKSTCKLIIINFPFDTQVFHK